MTKTICNQCGGEYDDGGNYFQARIQHLNTRRHQKYLEERYDANPKFWDKVYRKNVKKVNEMNKNLNNINNVQLQSSDLRTDGKDEARE